MNRPLTIFVPHCSGLLTDTSPHGDGLVAHGFISRLAEHGHTLHVAAERVELAQPLPGNVKLYPIELSASGGMIGRVRYMLKVRALFHRLRQNVRFDLIHQLNPVYTGVSLAIWPAEIPIILGPYVADWPVDPHSISGAGSGIRRFLGSTKNILAHLQQRSASAILITTEEARARIVQADRRSASIHLLPHGIDSNLFSPAVPSANKAVEESVVILFYANLSERKGIFDLLQAFELVAARYPHAELRIAGAGEELAAATEVTSRSSTCHRVRFLGRQTREQAIQLLREADIYCLPSHGEPYGMTVVEAMSCGLPVVVTDTGGVRWVVDDQGGIRIPMKQPARLAEALGTLLSDPDGRQAMGRHNRQKVVSNFTWERVIARLEEIYLENLRSGRKRSPHFDVLSPSLVKGLPEGGERT